MYYTLQDRVYDMGIIYICQSTKMFGGYIDDWKILNDNYILVTPLTPGARSVFC